MWQEKSTGMKQNSCCHMLRFYSNLKYSSHMGTHQQNDQYFCLPFKCSYTVIRKNSCKLYLERIQVIPLPLLLLHSVVFSREQGEEGDAAIFITIKIS